MLRWILVALICAISSADEPGTPAPNEGKKHAHLWNYDKLGGPTKWGKMYPDNCGEQKHRQSPVDIEKQALTFVEDWDEISLSYSNTDDETYSIVNNGHTVKVRVNGMLQINGGGLGESFKIVQFHFHWGADEDHGSEHLIDGKAFPLEMHMVSYDTGRFTNLKEALGGFNSLAVLGTLFTVSEEDNPAFEPIIRVLTEIKHKGDSTGLGKIDPSSLLPSDTSKFYRYDGSLTTPPCLENVIWTVFATEQTISKNQLNKFRECFQLGDEGEEMPLIDNYRPPQPLQGREIYSSFQPIAAAVNSDPSAQEGAATIVKSSVVLLLCMVVMLFA